MNFLSTDLRIEAINCATLSSAAYAAPDTALALIKTGFPGASFDWIDIPPTGTKAILCSVGDKIYLSFQGTVPGFDFLTDGFFELVSSGVGGHCHRLFLSTAMADFYVIGKKIRDLRLQNPNSKLVITGHSLGGALAMIFASLLKAKDGTICIQDVITFGQPRCGNSDFTKAFDALSIRYTRFINSGDIVPDVPVQLGKSDWQHSGNGWVFEGSNVRPWNSTDYTNAPADVAELVVNFIVQSIEKRALDKTVPDACIAHHKIDFYLQNATALLKNVISLEPNRVGVEI